MRILGVQAVLGGERPSAVMRRFGLCRTTIYRWLRTVDARGLDGLARRRHPGRAPRVPAAVASQVRRWILGRSPSDHGLPGVLWSRSSVAALVRARCGLAIGPAAAGRLLLRIGLDPRRPRVAPGPVPMGTPGVLFCQDRRGAFLCRTVRRQDEAIRRAVHWMRERAGAAARLSFRPDALSGARAATQV
jgi:transposase